jgi:hypothetical protein
MIVQLPWHKVSWRKVMTHTKFIRLSGWGMVLAAVSLLLTFLPEADKILADLYQTFGAPATSAQHHLYQSLSEGVRLLPFPVAILLITLGLIGLNIRYGGQAGKTAKMALRKREETVPSQA